MFRRSGLGSSARARAQAQLSGQRISGIFEDSGDDLREYISTLYKKNNTLKVNPFNLHEISDLSDFSTADTVDQEWKEHRYSKTAATAIPIEGIRELALTGSRFLKKPSKLAVSQSPTVSKSTLKKVNEVNTRRPDAASVLSKSPSAALARLAQIESRIMNRRLNAHVIDSDEYLCSSDEKQISPKSSSELSGKGSRFLKRTATKQEVNVRDLKKEIGSSKKDQQNGHPKSSGRVVMVDSDEEELKRMLGGSFKFADENEFTKKSHKTPQHGSKLHNQPIMTNHQRSQVKMPSPPSVGIPLSQSPRMRFVKQCPFSSSEQSEIKSLDELFTEPSVAEDLKNLDSESSNEFRLNILTLEDLVPTVEQKMNKEAPAVKNEANQFSDVQSIQSTFRTTGLHVADELVSPDAQPSTLSREKDESELESDIMTESAIIGSEITEHLNGSPLSRKEKNFPENLHEQLKSDDESTLCSEYSEDFENSDYEVASINKDQSESCAEKSSKEELKTDYSDNSTSHSTSSTPTPDQSKSAASSESLYSLEKKQVMGLTKVAVKDTAIQTQPSGMAYTWSREEGVAVLGASLGAAYVDPTPIASHVISPDAIEALTAYSPASFALNDMLKQQLTLIQQFVQVSRHLYLSVVASIEKDNYHYTTLDETKEFIRRHRSPPLTLDEALEEVQQEMKQYHC
ncbi:uncharacterized protein C19orf44 homolog isoform X2 [Chiloscyllium plagiosum]|uniref:uncharacterized protein C19orf44 homolog isoform X2 n=1 Tax=Chiloscyllium plagiosum TaxID=36176 RepID=UPI001CB85A87|nr:uncharacterized protein C19orf44 homolog isoform X2 [Chiloscyllium plagiosum]